MRRILVLAFIALTTATAQANEDTWPQQLDQYKADLATYTAAGLYTNIIGYGAKAVISCSASTVVGVATVVADTFPVAGAFSEVIANLADEDYDTVDVDNFLSWQTLADGGRGTAGGAAVASAETIEFAFLWLLGDEDRSYQATRKVYESSYVAFTQLFAEDAACKSSITKVAVAYKELQKRADATELDLEKPVKLNLN